MIASQKLQKLISKIALYDDAIAYKELFLLYHSKLIEFSILITHSRPASEEVVSDVFMNIWKNRSQLTRIENFHLYIYIVTKNLSINCLLKLKKERTFCLDEMIVEFRSIYLDPEQMMITAEMFQRIREAVHQLPPKCRLIFKLVKEDGLKHREVAQLLNLSIKTVENQMTIALRKIGQSIRFISCKPTY